MQSVLVHLLPNGPCRYPLHWLSSAGSPCCWFSSPNQGVSQVPFGRVRAENDICLAGTPSDVQGFHEFDGAAFSNTFSRHLYSTKPINRAKVHPSWTGSIDSYYQNIEDLGVQPIGEGESVQLTARLFPIVIEDSTYCCEDIKKVDTGFIEDMAAYWILARFCVLHI